VVLYLVNQLRRMFQAHSDSNALGLYEPCIGLGEIAVNVSCAVACGKDNGTIEE
jgi:hypothetical protein